ncbi:hypothetical protein ACI2K4_25185 [Micromonospora sp. NPDC050397]|uniref:hypothetical protein n=1 Tax=Micromonospora sp. NPDC050397 TaxID=3364279 RepID=UPI00384DCD61
MSDAVTNHVALRPNWSCVSCGQEWPCTVRKRRLKYLYQGNPAELGNQLRLWLEQARGELPALTEQELTDRFVGWTDRPVTRREPELS